ncbi:hypothetical protein P2R64_00035 [Priestia megaterium]|uniref:hypothetical protein n=1 Tax=Priestia megaterium TaxID=1404 RepID=UPI0021C12C6D|nr:hypothetical protein [Priestia megaterium]MCT9851944.1 hypothetical protein [Priestia megaterium]MDF1958448.1 hypothetical protein [Priestia megaterium]
MNNHEEHEIIDTIISLLDIFASVLIEENPIITIVLSSLLKIITKDRTIRISFILLVIVLNITNND